ncbi:MAG: hypothetical protein ACLSWS_10660 [Faecalispora jeddahensis]
MKGSDAILFDFCISKGGEHLSNPKMGRPTDNPKDKTLFIRLDNESSEALEAYCEQERVTKAEAARRGIKKLKDDLKK